MNHEEARRLLQEGRKVRRRNWRSLLVSAGEPGSLWIEKVTDPISGEPSLDLVIATDDKTVRHLDYRWTETCKSANDWEEVSEKEGKEA